MLFGSGVRHTHKWKHRMHRTTHGCQPELAWLLGSDKARLRMHHEELSNDTSFEHFLCMQHTLNPVQTFSLLNLMNTEANCCDLLLCGAAGMMPARFARPENATLLPELQRASLVCLTIVKQLLRLRPSIKAQERLGSCKLV